MSKTKQELFALAREYLDKWYIEPRPIFYQLDQADIKRSQKSSGSGSLPILNKIDFSTYPRPRASKPRPVSNKKSVNSCPKPLDPSILENLKPTFSQKLFELIKQQGISETDCYTAAGLDRRLFSKIRSDDQYHPKKITVFALILGLKLNLQDAKDLLDAAGYSISHSLKMDVLMEFLIKEEEYNIIKANELLYECGCPLLGNVG